MRIDYRAFQIGDILKEKNNSVIWGLRGVGNQLNCLPRVWDVMHLGWRVLCCSASSLEFIHPPPQYLDSVNHMIEWCLKQSFSYADKALVSTCRLGEWQLWYLISGFQSTFMLSRSPSHYPGIGWLSTLKRKKAAFSALLTVRLKISTRDLFFMKSSSGGKV